MLHISRRIDTIDDLDALFAEPTLACALAGASGVLVQVFWSGSCHIEAIVSAILRLAPRATLVGASTAGQVAEGRFVREGVVVSVSCFSSATVECLGISVEPGHEEKAAFDLASGIAAPGGIAAVVLFASIPVLDASAVLRGIRRGLPSVPILGGGAILGPGSGVLAGSLVSPCGIVAATLRGRELRVASRLIRGWEPLGACASFTEVEGDRIVSIDGKPAIEYFRDCLDIPGSDDLYLLEFPLLIERGGRMVARNLISSDESGAIRITAAARAGEAARLGYLDLDAMRANLKDCAKELRSFGAEGLFVYSCVCRMSAMQDAAALETLPLQRIAPTAGFYTSGEFCLDGEETELLNATEVVVALREGPGLRAAGDEPMPSRDESLLASLGNNVERHAFMTSRLFRLVGSLSGRLQAANGELSQRNEQLLASNESLSGEVAERKRAEEREKAISAEKETLLRELQHRVKNSMAIISSIASLEAMQSQSAEARSALEKLQSRIAALASLYDNLYDTGDVEEIDLASYLGRVVDYASEGLGADAQGIAVLRDIVDVRIDVKRAISIGLIVNELVTDSLKHAFPDGRKGRLEVSLARDGPELILVVADDGVGLKANREAGFGLTLVRSLASSLDASFSMRSEGGARFELRVPI